MIASEIIDLAKAQKEWMVANTKTADLPPIVILEKDGKIIAKIIAPKVDRDVGLYAVTTSHSGFNPDFITFVNDAHYRQIAKEEKEKLPEYQYGDFQKMKKDGDTSIGDCLNIVRVGKDNECLATTILYSVKDSEVIWGERHDTDSNKASVSKDAIVHDGFIPDYLKKVMAQPVLMKSLPDNISKELKELAPEKADFLAARAMCLHLSSKDYFIDESLTETHREWTDVKSKSHRIVENMNKEGLLPKESTAIVGKVIDEFSETAEYKDKLLEIFKKYSYWFPTEIRDTLEDFVAEFEQEALFPDVFVNIPMSGSNEKRVKVWNGDKSTYLGEGTLVGEAKVFFIRMPDGSIRSQENAEEEPKDVPDGARVISTMNPKIVLDNGKTVYGCQTWWELDNIPVNKSENKQKFGGKPKYNVAK